MEAIEQATTFGLNMVTLPPHPSHALRPLDTNCFKPFKNVFNNFEWDFIMAKNNYLEQNKVTLAKWVDKVVQQFLEKKKHKIKV